MALLLLRRCRAHPTENAVLSPPGAGQRRSARRLSHCSTDVRRTGYLGEGGSATVRDWLGDRPSLGGTLRPRKVGGLLSSRLATDIPRGLVRSPMLRIRRPACPAGAAGRRVRGDRVLGRTEHGLYCAEHCASSPPLRRSLAGKRR